MSGVRAGIIYSSLSRYALKVIALVSTVLIARLLSPGEIGTFAIASSLVMLLAEVRLLGASVYLVREEFLTDDKIKSAYGLTIIMCWGLGILIILSSGWLANFFSLPELELILIILASSFVFVPYISIPDAILSRNYQFKEITVVRVVPAFLQVFVTIGLIYQGYSYYSLALGYFFSMLFQMVLSLYFTRKIKVYMPRFEGLKVIVRLGVYSSLANIFRRSQFTASDLVIGKMGSPIQVGIFSRGMGFVDFISQSLIDGINPVVLPYLSEIKRQGLDIAQAYQRASVLLISLLWPVMAVAVVASLPAIRLLFGEQWDAAAPIASILALWICVKSVHGFSSYALLAAGHEKSMLIKDGLVFISLFPALILTFPIGFNYMAYGFLFCGVLDLVISGFFMRSKLRLNLTGYYLSLLPSFYIAFICFVVVFLLDIYLDFSVSEPWLVFFIISVLVIPLWLFLVKLFKQPIYNEVRALFKKLNRR